MTTVVMTDKRVSEVMNTYCDTCGTYDDVAHEGREASRLSDADRERVDARLRETLARWAGNSPTRRYIPTWGDVDTLVRIMAHAIGCGSYDLRVCELDEIRGKACATIGATYDHAGRFVR